MAAIIHPNIARMAEAYERALFPRLLGASILQRLDGAGNPAAVHPDGDGRGHRKRKARTTRQGRTHPRGDRDAAAPSLSSSLTQGDSEQAHEEIHEEGSQTEKCRKATPSSSGTTNSSSRGAQSSSTSTSHQHGRRPSVEQLGLDGPALDDLPPPIRPIVDADVELPQRANQGRPSSGPGDPTSGDSEAEAEEDEDLTSFQIDLQPIPWPLFQSQIRRRILNARKRGDGRTVPLIQELEISGRRWLVLLPEREFTRGQALRMLRSDAAGGGGEGEMQMNWD